MEGSVRGSPWLRITRLDFVWITNWFADSSRDTQLTWQPPWASPWTSSFVCVSDLVYVPSMWQTQYVELINWLKFKISHLSHLYCRYQKSAARKLWKSKDGQPGAMAHCVLWVVMPSLPYRQRVEWVVQGGLARVGWTQCSPQPGEWLRLPSAHS